MIPRSPAGEYFIARCPNIAFAGVSAATTGGSHDLPPSSVTEINIRFSFWRAMAYRPSFVGSAEIITGLRPNGPCSPACAGSSVNGGTILYVNVFPSSLLVPKTVHGHCAFSEVGTLSEL